MTKEQFIKTSPDKRRLYLFIRHPLTILFAYAFMFIWGMCLNPFFNNPRKHFDGLIALVVHLGIAAALLYFGGGPALLLTQAIPCFICFAIGSYLFYAQHNFPDVTFGDKLGWTYEKAAMESSSYMRTGSIMAWFTANIGYHHVHYLNARIPFYRLPEVLKKCRSCNHLELPPSNPQRFSAVCDAKSGMLKSNAWSVSVGDKRSVRRIEN